MKNIKISEKTNLFISISSLFFLIPFIVYATLKYSNIKNAQEKLEIKCFQFNDLRIVDIEYLRHKINERNSVENERFKRIENYMEKNTNNIFQFQKLKEDLQDLEQDLKTLK